jgi:hypothetical protein
VPRLGRGLIGGVAGAVAAGSTAGEVAEAALGITVAVVVVAGLIAGAMAVEAHGSIAGKSWGRQRNARSRLAHSFPAVRFSVAPKRQPFCRHR